MKVAVKCLTYVLRKVYNYKVILPVASGRRGVHTWVLDEEGATLSQSDREGIVNRIEMLGKPAIYNHPVYTPYLYEFILKPAFIDHFLDQQCLISDPGTTHLLFEIVTAHIFKGNTEACYSSELRDSLLESLVYIHRARTVEERTRHWDEICKLLPPWFEQHFVFTLLYPRLDRNVTTLSNHCVKAPFVIHPTTKRCSVPIPNIETWQPHTAPRLSELVDMPNSNPYGWRPNYDEEETKGVILAKYVNHLEHMLLQAYPHRNYHI
jgi:DNA primase small subunit